MEREVEGEAQQIHDNTQMPNQPPWNFRQYGDEWRKELFRKV